eukprot:1682015-Amphidinium_carterae.3
MRDSGYTSVSRTRGVHSLNKSPRNLLGWSAGLLADRHPCVRPPSSTSSTERTFSIERLARLAATPDTEPT